MFGASLFPFPFPHANVKSHDKVSHGSGLLNLSSFADKRPTLEGPVHLSHKSFSASNHVTEASILYCLPTQLMHGQKLRM